MLLGRVGKYHRPGLVSQGFEGFKYLVVVVLHLEPSPKVASALSPHAWAPSRMSCVGRPGRPRRKPSNTVQFSPLGRVRSREEDVPFRVRVCGRIVWAALVVEAGRRRDGDGRPRNDCLRLRTGGWGFELYTMRADGSRQRRLTSNQPTTAFPAWSPDGRRLAYINGALGELWVMRADGGKPRRVTSGFRVAIYSPPTWSPDGTRLAVEARRMGRSGIWIVNLQTERVRQLTTGLFDTAPAWSPKGRQIVFARPLALERGLYEDELYAIAPTGGVPKRLTRTPRIEELTPSWSRGGRLAFAALRGDRTDLFVMNANGSGRRAVTSTSDASEYEPNWSPDGTKLVFVDGQRLSIINVDGDPQAGVRSQDFSGKSGLVAQRLPDRLFELVEHDVVACAAERPRASSDSGSDRLLAGLVPGGATARLLARLPSPRPSAA